MNAETRQEADRRELVRWRYTAIAVLCLLLLGRFLIGVVLFARMMIDKWTTEIVITSDRLIYKRGWIARHVEEIALNRIEEVVLDQTAIARGLGYGRIIVAGTGRGIIRLPGWLADPVGLGRGSHLLQNELRTLFAILYPCNLTNALCFRRPQGE